MTETLEMTEPPVVRTDDGSARSNRWLWLAVVVLGLLSMALGAALVVATDSESVPEGTVVPTAETTADQESTESTAVVPVEVEQVIDDVTTAWVTADEDLFRSIATEEFFYNEDFYSAGQVTPDFTASGPLFSMANAIDGSTWEVERFGDMIVAGDGPWVVTVGEVWFDYANRWDGVATYLLVDEGGTLKVDKYDWVGVGVPVQPDFGN